MMAIKTMGTKSEDQIEDEMVEAAILNANNFGKAVDMFHPDYGWILKDGEPTEAGLDFFQEQLEPFQSSLKGHS
jgi:hypothetical protein